MEVFSSIKAMLKLLLNKLGWAGPHSRSTISLSLLMYSMQDLINFDQNLTLSFNFKFEVIPTLIGQDTAIHKKSKMAARFQDGC